jgi:hypothetical protein
MMIKEYCHITKLHPTQELQHFFPLFNHSQCYEARYSDLDGKGGREHYLEIGSD